MRSEEITLSRSPEEYARQATRWGLNTPPESAHQPEGAGSREAPQPPNDWSPMHWMLESRRVSLAWARKATEQQLAELIEHGGHASLEQAAGFPLEPETLEATIRTARQALGTRGLKSAAGLLTQKARRQPGTWQDLGQTLDERDALWIRDMLRRAGDLSVKVKPDGPQALRFHVAAMAMAKEGDQS